MRARGRTSLGTKNSHSSGNENFTERTIVVFAKGKKVKRKEKKKDKNKKKNLDGFRFGIYIAGKRWEKGVYIHFGNSDGNINFICGC